MPSSTTLIAIDIGNSGLRAAQIESSNADMAAPLRINWLHPSAAAPQRIAEQAIPCGERFPPDSQAWFPCLSQWLEQVTNSGIGTEREPVRWLVSSVRRDALERLRQFVEAHAHHSLKVISYSDVPLVAAVDEPLRLGIDRLLAAYAAATLVESRPLLVIQAGSAVTVDLVECDGEVDRFSGGAILPGVPMMLRLLGQAAEMLPELDADDLTEFPQLPGKNTEAAMLCGTASCLIGGIQHLVTRFREQFGSQTQVVISGGDGSRLLPNIPPPVVVIPNLVLQGVVQLAHTLRLA